MKKIFAVLLALCVIFGASAVRAEEEKKIIAISVPPVVTDWQRQFLRELASEITMRENYIVTVKVAKNVLDQERTLYLMRDYGFSAVIILPSDPVYLDDICEQIYNTGTVTVLVDKKIPSGKYTAFIGFDLEAEGAMAAGLLSQALGGAGNVMELYSDMNGKENQGRLRGILSSFIKNDRIKTVIKTDGFYSMDSGIRAAKTAFSAFNSAARAKPEKGKTNNAPKTIDGIVATNTDSALGAYNQLIAERRKDIKAIVSIGLPKSAAELLLAKDAKFYAAVTHSPSIGVEALRMAIKLIRGEPVEHELLLVPQAVTKANIANYMYDVY